MSGPLSHIFETISRLSARRAEARVRGRMRRLAEGVYFTGFATHPPVRDFGNFLAAREGLNGQLALGGYRAPLADLTPWDMKLPTAGLYERLHGFEWLDDLEALSGKTARARAQTWTTGWLDRYEHGSGPGWGPAVAARRLRRLIIHHPFLAKDDTGDQLKRVERALPLHAAYVADSWAQETEGSARVAALTGVITAAIALKDQDHLLSPALIALAGHCRDRVSPQGGIPSRNPEALLSIFRDLLAVQALLGETARPPAPDIEAAIRRIAPCLRALRHGDGTLARFHGGGPGAAGLLDRSLAESRVRSRPTDKPAMGFVRLAGGRTQLIVDCARPPEHSDHGHASTLAFEMSCGRRPMIVNVGPAIPQAPDLWRGTRATSAHSTLSLDKTSSSRLGPARATAQPGFDALQTRPSMVTLAQARDATGAWIQARHDGYLEDYGLLHERRLFVSINGAEVHGEDVLLSPDANSRRRFSARIKGASKLGVALALHFHLHPEVKAAIDHSTDSLRLTLPSGETWQFRHQGGLMDLETSAYLDPEAPEPVKSRQIVVSSRATTHEAQISWSFLRESGPTRALRDVGATQD